MSTSDTHSCTAGSWCRRAPPRRRALQRRGEGVVEELVGWCDGDLIMLMRLARGRSSSSSSKMGWM